MTEKSKTLWLRIAYWLGIVLDAMEGTRMTVNYFKLKGNELAQTMTGMGAALMWGWTILLFWADRKPVERKGVLLITALPVVLLILLSNLNVGLSYEGPILQKAYYIIGGALLLIFFLVVYFITERKVAQSRINSK